VSNFNTELTAEEFAIIKKMCNHEAYIIIAPHNMPDDPEETKKAHIEHTEILFSIARKGFMENVTHEFSELLIEARKQDKRTFDAFVLTQQSISMFSAPEGPVN